MACATQTERQSEYFIQCREGGLHAQLTEIRYENWSKKWFGELKGVMSVCWV